MNRLALLLAVLAFGCEQPPEYLQNEKITLTFLGPDVKETGDAFTDYRLEVRFTNANQELVIPGFFSADGNAAESGAGSGNVWQVRFRPEVTGEWSYSAQLTHGAGIAVSNDPGEVLELTNAEGSFSVVENSTDSWLSKGRLIANGGRYRIHSKSNEVFVKGGPDSPENFLAFVDFDNTYRYAENNRSGEAGTDTTLHRYEPHVRDWKEGDPGWKDGKGKGIIGALNYLASKRMNVVYMLTMNIEGDGKDVWPYTSPDDFRHFDCSKLDQWEIVFDHMDRLGITQHFVLQETENETLLDDGDTGFERKLYLREMIARFAHHPGVTWNIGEENGPADFTPVAQNTAQQKAMIQYISETDPYDNLVVVHTHAAKAYRHSLMGKLLGDEHLTGLSLQIDRPVHVYEETTNWIEASVEAGQPWVVSMDEIGPYWAGVHPDGWENNNQDTLIRDVLWGHLLAGGAGVEWYFGYKAPHNDLNCEDWRSRDRIWTATANALDFFRELPLDDMQPHSQEAVRVFSKADDVYVAYLPQGDTTTIELGDGSYTLGWFNPFDGSAEPPEGGVSGAVQLHPPDNAHDWVAKLTRE